LKPGSRVEFLGEALEELGTPAGDAGTSQVAGYSMGYPKMVGL